MGQLLYWRGFRATSANNCTISATIAGLRFGHLCGYFCTGATGSVSSNVCGDKEHLCLVAKPKQSIRQTPRVDIGAGQQTAN